MKISTISIDLAKNVFQLMMFDEHHKVQQEKRLNRSAFHQLIQQHPPCNVVMEACYSSHYWARELQRYGFQVKLIPAQHVTPFVRGNKNDRNKYRNRSEEIIEVKPIITHISQNLTRGDLITDIGIVFLCKIQYQDHQNEHKHYKKVGFQKVFYNELIENFHA